MGGCSSQESGAGSVHRQSLDMQSVTGKTSITAKHSPAPSLTAKGPKKGPGGSQRAESNTFFVLRKTEPVRDKYTVAEELGKGQVSVLLAGASAMCMAWGPPHGARPGAPCTAATPSQRRRLSPSCLCTNPLALSCCIPSISAQMTAAFHPLHITLSLSSSSLSPPPS